MLFKRAQYQQIIDRLNEDSLRIQVLVGPRQVGKTTLIGQVCEAISQPYDSFSADDVASANQDWIAQIWENTRLKMKAQGLTEYILV